jgi:alkane 1-monooxygenase
MHRRVNDPPPGGGGAAWVAFFPPLRFRVMDPRVLAHAQGDGSRINFDPAQRASLVGRYGLAE